MREKFGRAFLGTGGYTLGNLVLVYRIHIDISSSWDFEVMSIYVSLDTDTVEVHWHLIGIVWHGTA